MSSANLELEVKILDINIYEIKKKLQALGAEYIGEHIQKIYTYDLYPVSSTYHAILWTINKPTAEKVQQLSIQKLKAIFYDLDDLLSKKDRESIKALTGFDSLIAFSDSIKALDNSLLLILNNRHFIEIVEGYQTNPNKWVRLRSEDNQVTLAVKQIFNRRTDNVPREHSLTDMKEFEITVDSLDKTRDLLEQLGFFHKNYQEKRRASYILERRIKIDIDQWPLIPPYVEIEAKDAELIYRTVDLLGYNRDDIKIMNADDVYSFYGLDMYAYKELRFDRNQ